MRRLSDYLARSAQLYPERPAVEIDGEAVSYRELHRMAASLAAGMLRAGIEPGDRVALWMPKQVETYAAVYACLRLGAAYVPIDIASPPERVRYICRDGECRGLVCLGRELNSLGADLPDGLAWVAVADGPSLEEMGAREEIAREEIRTSGETRLLSLPAWTRAGAETEAGRPSPELPAEDLPAEDPDGAFEPYSDEIAYVLYTSGSTGHPKGVALSHRAGAAFAAWAGDLVRLSEDDRVSNHAALSFDLSIFDIFATARAGAVLLPVPGWVSGKGYPFARFIQDRRISVWYSVPTILDRIAASQAKKRVDLGSLRTVIFAGEPFPKAGLKAFAAEVPGARLLNFYGPTETNVCLFHEVESDDLASDRPLPIGRACPYSELRLRDESCDSDSGTIETERVGELAELLVAGASLMSGYWRGGGPDAGVMIEIDGRPFYPTGDFVTRDGCGSFLFQGRRDHQIKLHGYRIELGEIEEALCAQPDVVEAAVLCTGDDLVAFVATGTGAAPDEHSLYHALEDALPPYMVPAEVRHLDALPRTDRGKIDRRSLADRLTPEPAPEPAVVAAPTHPAAATARGAAVSAGETGG